MDLKYGNLVADLSSGSANKQVSSLLDVIQQGNLGRDIRFWLPAVVSRGMAQGADKTVRKLTYHIVRSCFRQLETTDIATIHRQIISDVEGEYTEVSIYALRCLQASTSDLIKGFLNSSAGRRCFTPTISHKIREEAATTIAELASRAPASGPSRDLYITDLIEKYSDRIVDSALDVFDNVSAAAFEILSKLLNGSANPAVCSVFSKHIHKLIYRISFMSDSYKATSLIPISLLSTTCCMSDVVISKLLVPTLSFHHFPRLVIAAGRSTLLINSLKDTDSKTSVSEETLAKVVSAFLTILLTESADTSHALFLIKCIVGVLPKLSIHTQWSCAVKFLNLASLFNSEEHLQIRILIYVVGFDRVMRLSLPHVASQLQSGKTLSPDLYPEVRDISEHKFWSSASCTAKEEMIYILCNAVMQAGSYFITSGEEANLAAWTSVGLHIVSMCMGVFKSDIKSEYVAPLHQVLKLSLKVFSDGTAQLGIRKKQKPGNTSLSEWVASTNDQHLQNQKKLCSLILGGLGDVCRNVTKVGILCTVASLLPTEPEADVKSLEESLRTRLVQGCSRFMVDDRETLSLSLFDALMCFGATRGKEAWKQCDAAIESILRDIKKSATAPQVLMVVKHKLDNIRKHRNIEIGLSTQEVANCGVIPFSEHHPALYHDFSPCDYSLYLQSHDALMDMRVSLLKTCAIIQTASSDDTAVQSTAVITSPDDPVQILAKYYWKRNRIEVCMSVSNATLITLKDLRITIGCKGEMVPMFKPHRSVFDNDSDITSRIKTHSRSDTITQLHPGETIQIVRVFLIASLSPTMGFNALVDLKMNETDDSIDILGGGGDEGTCRIHSDIFPVSLPHFFKANHPLRAHLATDALQIVAALQHSHRINTIHVEGDLEAIEQRLDWSLFDTPFVNLTPCFESDDKNHQKPLHAVFISGTRSLSIGNPGVVSLTVTALGSATKHESGNTSGTILHQDATIPFGSVALSWQFQGSSAEVLNNIVGHPSFESFFADVADLSDVQQDSSKTKKEKESNVYTTPPSQQASLRHWKDLKKRYEKVKTSVRVHHTSTQRPADSWEDFRRGDREEDLVDTSQPLFASPGPDLFQSRSTPSPTPVSDLFSKRNSTPPPSTGLFPSEGNDLFSKRQSVPQPSSVSNDLFPSTEVKESLFDKVPVVDSNVNQEVELKPDTTLFPTTSETLFTETAVASSLFDTKPAADSKSEDVSFPAPEPSDSLFATKPTDPSLFDSKPVEPESSLFPTVPEQSSSFPSEPPAVNDESESPSSLFPSVTATETERADGEPNNDSLFPKTSDTEDSLFSKEAAPFPDTTTSLFPQPLDESNDANPEVSFPEPVACNNVSTGDSLFAEKPEEVEVPAEVTVADTSDSLFSSKPPDQHTADGQIEGSLFPSSEVPTDEKSDSLFVNNPTANGEESLDGNPPPDSQPESLFPAQPETSSLFNNNTEDTRNAVLSDSELQAGSLFAHEDNSSAPSPEIITPPPPGDDDDGSATTPRVVESDSPLPVDVKPAAAEESLFDNGNSLFPHNPPEEVVDSFPIVAHQDPVEGGMDSGSCDTPPPPSDTLFPPINEGGGEGQGEFPTADSLFPSIPTSEVGGNLFPSAPAGGDSLFPSVPPEVTNSSDTFPVPSNGLFDFKDSNNSVQPAEGFGDFKAPSVPSNSLFPDETGQEENNGEEVNDELCS